MKFLRKCIILFRKVYIYRYYNYVQKEYDINKSYKNKHNNFSNFFRNSNIVTMKHIDMY
jgi:hypothetical protein